MNGLCRQQRALIPRIRAYNRRFVQIKKRRQRAQIGGTICIYLLLNGQDMNRREVRLGGFLRINIGDSRVGRAEVNTDVHYAAARSRTLNSSFQRRPSAATHQSSSSPVSVTLLSNV